MKFSELTCPKCGAGFRRLELETTHGTTGEYRCPVCNHVVETFDGSKLVAYRMTIQPQISWQGWHE